MERLLTSPPAAFCILLALAYGLYRVGGAIAARGQDHPGKRQPYACGEDLPPPEARLSYRAFFRLALMFGILHLATLVISTLPQENASHWVATGYLIGIGVAMLVLTEGAW